MWALLLLTLAEGSSGQDWAGAPVPPPFPPTAFRSATQQPLIPPANWQPQLPPAFIGPPTTTTKAPDGNIRVATTRGVALGKRLMSANGYASDAFLSLPYAEPPRRFQRSQLKQPWGGVWDARSRHLACTVARRGPGPAQVSPDSGEDCLYMKILVPANRREGELLPVFFWPHGGGFNGGSANDYDLDAQAENFVVAKRVVLAQPTYRVGPFGFFSTGTAEAPGNFGSWDVLNALEFVNQEIESFGGDPKRITLMGQGAGAIQNSLLTLSPQAAGMYSQAVMLSGSMLMPQVNERVSEIRRKNQAFALAAGCDDRSSLRVLRGSRWRLGQFRAILSCLGGQRAEALLAASAAAGLSGSLGWHPIVDGVGGLLPRPLESLARTRHLFPVIMGDTADETAWDLFVQPSIAAAAAADPQSFQLKAPANLDILNQRSAVLQECDNVVTSANFDDPSSLRAICKSYFAADPSEAVFRTSDPLFWFQQSVKVGSSFRYHAPIQRDLEFHLANGNPHVFRYSFDYVRVQGVPMEWWTTGRSFHNLDLALLERFFPGQAYRFAPDTRDAYITLLLTSALANFAYTANASTADVTWRPMSGVDRYSVLSVDYPARMKTTTGLSDELFWNRLAPAAVTATRTRNSDAFPPFSSDEQTYGYPVETSSFQGVLRERPNAARFADADSILQDTNNVISWLRRFIPSGVLQTMQGDTQ